MEVIVPESADRVHCCIISTFTSLAPGLRREGVIDSGCEHAVTMSQMSQIDSDYFKQLKTKQTCCKLSLLPAFQLHLVAAKLLKTGLLQLVICRFVTTCSKPVDNKF